MRTEKTVIEFACDLCGRVGAVTRGVCGTLVATVPLPFDICAKCESTLSDAIDDCVNSGKHECSACDAVGEDVVLRLSAYDSEINPDADYRWLCDACSDAGREDI